MMPPLVAALLVACSERAGHLGSLDLAREYLIAGQAAAAERVLGELEASAWVGRQARKGRAIARALLDVGGVETESAHEESGDASTFPLETIARGAFERGEFDAVLRLSQLADTTDEAVDATLVLASHIELGHDVSANELAALPVVPSVMSGETEEPTLVAARVREHLSQPEAGSLLFDRRGEPLGRVVDGALVPAAGIDATLLPANIVDRVADFPDAGSLHLTLDLELSRIAKRAFGRFKGSIVLVDPSTGEVLAAVSDRRTYEREEGRAAFEQGREPASIAKIITTAASLRSGHDPDDELRRKYCRGHEVYAGERLYCPVIAGHLRGLDRAMAVSCNVAFADLGVEVGRRGVLEELTRWGFGEHLGAFRGGRVLRTHLDDRELADLSIGLQHSEVTPLHAALLAATVANRGRRPAPTLVAAVDGKLGLHPRALPVPESVQVIDPDWAEELHESMEYVVRRGTAMRVRTPGFPVAMKTGTASDPRWGFHVNYIGYGPVTGDPADARVAFAVRITNQGTSKKVRYAAVEVTARLLRGLRTAARDRDWLDGPEAFDQRLASVRTDPRALRYSSGYPAGSAESVRVGR